MRLEALSSLYLGLFKLIFKKAMKFETGSKGDWAKERNIILSAVNIIFNKARAKTFLSFF